MPNDMVTAGKRAPQVKFPSSVLPVLWMCTTVFSWFTPSLMDCRVWSQIIAFGWGPIALQRLKTPAILKWPSTIVTVTHTHMYNVYIFIHIMRYEMHIHCAGVRLVSSCFVTFRHQHVRSSAWHGWGCITRLCIGHVIVSAAASPAQPLHACQRYPEIWQVADRSNL